MSTVEARQLSLRFFEAAKRGETLSRSLLQEASKETVRAPGSRAAVLAQRAYDERMSAEVSRFTAAFALVAHDLGQQARSARSVAEQVKDMTQRRVTLERVRNTERHADAMLEAARAMTKATEHLPGIGLPKPPSAHQVTVGTSAAFRPASFLDRFAHFFPSDIRAAASSLSGVPGFREYDDAVKDAQQAIARDLPKLRQNAIRIGELMRGGSGDPAFQTYVRRAIGLAGVGAIDFTPEAQTRFSSAHYGITPMQATIGGVLALGAIYYFTRRS